MTKTLEFPDMLRLIDERSAAFRDVIASAPSLDVQVPTCPEWTLADLAQHMGQGRLRWAATVQAGPADARPATAVAAGETEAPRDRKALVAWLADSTQQLLDRLREAGPDRGCWTWWGDSQSPETSGAVARHQLQEVAVHTYDAQLTVGSAEPLPADVAHDGVDEFLSTCCATTIPWPYEPAIIDYHVSQGGSWRLWLSGDGVRVGSVPEADGEADVTGTASAGEFVLVLYGRKPVDSLAITGDQQILDRIAAWDPDA